MSRVLITGVTGQSGSYLAEHLISKGDEVFGMVRDPRRLRWAEGIEGLTIIKGNITRLSDVLRAVESANPLYVYNLAAKTSPGGSWGALDTTELAEVNAMGTLNVMMAVRENPAIRAVHASSSAIYASDHYGLYGASKLFAHTVVQGFRRGFGLHVSSAILYSHTSPRQAEDFLIRRIVTAAARADTIELTDLDSVRAWAYAPDIVKVLPRMAYRIHPQDFDIAGDLHSVREIVAAAYSAAGLPWQNYVKVNSKKRHPPFSEYAATNHARIALEWLPSKPFTEYVADMVHEEMGK
jgi:GDPmannose 4,6-dehydratase